LPHREKSCVVRTFFGNRYAFSREDPTQRRGGNKGIRIGEWLLPPALFHVILFNMTITQTVEIPASHRLTIDVPREVPAGTGTVTLTFAPAETERIKERGFGCAKGQFHMAEDFDAPLEDFKDYM